MTGDFHKGAGGGWKLSEFWPDSRTMRSLSGLEVKLYLLLVARASAGNRDARPEGMALSCPTTTELVEKLAGDRVLISRSMRALAACSLLIPPGQNIGRDQEDGKEDAASRRKPRRPEIVVRPIAAFEPASEEPDGPILAHDTGSGDASEEVPVSGSEDEVGNSAENHPSDNTPESESSPESSGTRVVSGIDKGSEADRENPASERSEESEEDRERRRERERERERRYREKSKAFYGDLERKPEVKRCLEVLQNIEGWPTGYEKDRRTSEKLEEYIEKWPDTDPLKVCEHFSSYYAHKGVGGQKSRPLAKLHTFFENEQRYGKARRDAPDGRFSLAGNSAPAYYGVRDASAQPDIKDYFVRGGREGREQKAREAGEEAEERKSGDSGAKEDGMKESTD